MRQFIKEEKQRFQRGKNKCRNRNVKFYRNGKVRSVVNYKMQKSLARGNVLCNDCDDKGNLCAAPSKKDDLASIYMGNNNYSEFWGGQAVVYDSFFFGGWTQLPGDVLINSDISGVWGGSLTDVSKADLSNATLPASTVPNVPLIQMPFGYVNNLIKIPRNFDGSGITIDPSNVLFPDELCDPFRYLQRSYLKTYLVVTSLLGLPISPISPNTLRALTCDDPSANSQIGRGFSVTGGAEEYAAFGVISSICCVGNTDKFLNGLFNGSVVEGNFGIFNMYIELSQINLRAVSRMINYHNNKAFTPYSELPLFTEDSWVVGNSVGQQNNSNDMIIWHYMVQSLNLIQGSIPPSQNQTKYNATKQSYMSCLENGTSKIKFTKQNTRIPVKNAFCTPSPPACVPEITFTIQLIIGTPVLPTFVNLSDGKYLLFDIGSNTNTTWNFNIIDISNSCPGEPANLKIDYLVVGGGGSGGYSSGSGQVGTTGGGGDGDVRQGTFTISGGSTHNFIVQAGAGSPGIGNGASEIWTERFTTDASSSRLELNSTLIASANPGQNGASATFPVGISGSADFLGATEGGESGGTGIGGIIIDPSTNNPVDGSGTPIVRGSAGGGGSNQDGSNNGVFGDTSTWYIDINGRYFTSGGNGGDGVSSSITGSTVSYGGGGGGACFPLASPPPGINILPGLGANGGPGGNGANVRNTVGNAATQYGGGGGGSVYVDVSQNGGAGKRGVVILKFYNAPA